MVECLRALGSQLGSDRVAAMENLYNRQLWHELTQELLLLQGDVLIPIFRDFLKSFQERVNPIRLAELAIRVANLMRAEEAIPFLDSVKVQEPQAQLLLTIARGAKLVDLGQVYESEAVLDECQKRAELLSDLENTLYSGLYKSLARVHKMKGNHELFYRFSLQYLAYTPPDQVEDPQALAADLAVAVLVADTLYNLGELIEQPVFVNLKNTPHAELYALIVLCYEGRVAEFERALLSPSLPEALKSGREVLLQKVKILAVMELAFRRERGKLTFSEIAEVAGIEQDKVEFLLMKAMAKDLLRGQIDQVESVVVFNYVQPRILDATRLQQIRTRISNWKETVGNVLKDLEQNSKELID